MRYTCIILVLVVHGCCPMVAYHSAKMMLVWTTYLWRWGWHLVRPMMMTRTMMRWHLLVFLLISWLVFLLISWFSVYGIARPICCLFVLLSWQTNKPFGTVLSNACLLLSSARLNEPFFASLWSSACLNYAFIFSLVKCHQWFFMHMRCWKKNMRPLLIFASDVYDVEWIRMQAV
jgi:hypothetical protein